MVNSNLKNLISEKEQIISFDKYANNSKAWFDKVSSNYLCAVTLFEKYKETYDSAIQDSIVNGGCGKWPALLDVYEQSLFSLGVSVECLLKGVYINNGGIISKDGKFVKNIKTHDLVELCELCNSNPNEKELDLFKKLTLIIYSYGRYPTPVSYRVNPLVRTKEYGFKPKYVSSWSDFDIAEDFIVSYLGVDFEK